MAKKPTTLKKVDTIIRGENLAVMVAVFLLDKGVSYSVAPVYAGTYKFTYHPDHMFAVTEFMKTGAKRIACGQPVEQFSHPGRKHADRRKAYLVAAKQDHEEDGILEFDDNAVISESAEHAYVAGWTYISAADAGLKNLEEDPE
jgi:hypothetical protein